MNIKNQKLDIKYFPLMLIILFALLITSTLEARSVTTPPRTGRIRDKQYLTINRWRCPFYNEGRYAYDEATGEGGGFWPYPLQNGYVFGAGPWVGAITANNDTLVTCGYNPNTAAGEFFPAPAFEASTGNAMDRIYVSPRDWPPPQSRYGYDTTLVPQKSFSLQDMWCVYSDLQQDYHVSPGTPIGVEVYQTVYAWNYPTNQDIFFITYKVKNASADTIRGMILGACMDPDIGESGYQVPEEGDMIGLIKEAFIGGDTIRDVFYVGDYNNIETNPQYWQSGTPGVVSYKFLEGARDPQTNAPLGMTSAKKFTIDIDPPTDVAQYLTLAGYDYRTGIYSPYDSIDEQPLDKRFVTCTGPFNLAPEQHATILVACLAAPYGDAGEIWPNRDTNDLKPLCKLAVTAQYIYDQGWLLPGPPTASDAVLFPMDKAIRVVWNDLAERSPDPYYEVASDTAGPGYDSLYKKYDFEGYKIYKSSDGLVWSLVTQCDLNNNILFKVRNDSLFYNDTIAETDVTTRATDRGLFYSYIDTDVLNGFPYYYRVASYDFNFTTTDVGVDTLVFESNPQPISTRPRWEAPNYSDPSVSIQRVLGNDETPGLRCSTKIVLPYEIPTDPLRIKFAGPVYTGIANRAMYRYTVVDEQGTLIQDTVRFYYTLSAARNQNLPPLGGTELIAKMSITLPTRIYDTIYPVTGNYPAERLGQRTITVPFGQWAYRGSDYKIVWHVQGGIKTCQVFDMTNGEVEVPRTKFQTTPTWYDSMANGWCFVDRVFRNPNDTLKTASAYIYLNSGYLALNRLTATTYDTIGALMNQISDGDIWEVKASTGCIAAPYYNEFLFSGTPAIARTDTTYKLNVKVVPNPYLITNRWEISKFEKRIAFTHLPAQCAIRIYTVAGHLVKIIEHNDTNTNPMDQGGTEYWNLLNEHDQIIASGIYIFHIESDIGEQVGKFAVIQ
jgi:hypothetical protein